MLGPSPTQSPNLLQAFFEQNGKVPKIQDTGRLVELEAELGWAITKTNTKSIAGIRWRYTLHSLSLVWKWLFAEARGCACQKAWDQHPKSSESGWLSAIASEVSQEDLANVES